MRAAARAPPRPPDLLDKARAARDRQSITHAHTHAHAHHEHAGPRERDGSRRALRGALILNLAFLLVEAAAAAYSGSLALFSDAAHMVSDVAALALALTAAELARRPAHRDRTYGYARAEALGAFANAVLLLGACALIIHSAVHRLATGETQFEATPVLVVGALGLAINLGSAWVLHRSARHDLGVRGALIHMLADALGSLAAIAAAVLASVWALHAADAALSLAIAALILWSTWGVLRDATRALLDFVPEHLPRERVEAGLRALEGVQDVHELHLWSIGGAAVLTAHLVPRPGAATGELLSRAEHLLRTHLGVVHTTIQIDDRGPCAQHPCPLFEEGARSSHHHEHP